MLKTKEFETERAYNRRCFYPRKLTGDGGYKGVSIYPMGIMKRALLKNTNTVSYIAKIGFIDDR